MLIQVFDREGQRDLENCGRPYGFPPAASAGIVAHAGGSLLARLRPDRTNGYFRSIVLSSRSNSVMWRLRLATLPSLSTTMIVGTIKMPMSVASRP